MDFIEIKEEARDLTLHFTLETSSNGKFIGIKQINKNLEAAANACFSSSAFVHCPACQIQLNIIITVDPSELTDQEGKAEPPSPIEIDYHDATYSPETVPITLISPTTDEQSDKRLSCRYCQKSFTTLNQVRRHENYIHLKTNSQACYICGQQFTNSQMLSEHLAGHQLNDMFPFKCDICQAAFKYKKSVKSHIRRIHIAAEGNFNCDECGRKCKNALSLQKHKKRHQPKPHRCQYCGKGWVYKSELEQHERTHQDERQFGCETCGRRYKEKTDLTKHIKKAHTTRPAGDKSKGEFSCDVCSKTMLGENTLRAHKLLHNIKSGALECSECGQKFKNNKSVKSHMLRQHLPKPFQCHYCDRSWRYQSELIQHELIHTDTRPFSCPKCDFKFKLKGDLNRHLALHTKREEKGEVETAKRYLA